MQRNILLNAARHLFFENDMTFIWLDDGHNGVEQMFPDPIIRAEDAQTFEAIHTLMCLDTGADLTYVSVRRVVDWLSEGYTARRTKAAHA